MVVTIELPASRPAEKVQASMPLCRPGDWGMSRACVHVSFPGSLCPLLLQSFWPGPASSSFYSSVFPTIMCTPLKPHTSHPAPSWFVSPEVSFPRLAGIFKGPRWVTICSSLLTSWSWGWGHLLYVPFWSGQ